MSQLEEHGGQKVEAEFLGWIGSSDFEDHGQFVIGRVVEQSENENGKFLRMEREDGKRYNVSVPTAVRTDHNLREYEGEIIGLEYVGDIDVGQPQPMKDYDLYEFGAWPDIAGVESADIF